MTIPTGSGTEVLKRATLGYATTTDENSHAIFTSTNNHIYLIKSIIILHRYNVSDATVDITVDPASGNDYYLLKGQGVPASGSFVWNDVFVVQGGDTLKFECASGGTTGFDVLCTYIDQDWS